MAHEELLKRGTFVDRYEIRELLGVGGQGQVYRAYDPVLKRPVVIKALASMTDDFLRRFTREAEAISKMSHNNVVDILDFRVENGRPYIVMEYLAGQDLAARLAKGPMEVGEVVDTMLAVCSGVFACHRRGIIHRDLKPKNVFLSQSADYGTVVKVLDFGIARVVQGAEDSITEVGSLVGTPRYMAPEQLRPAGVVDEKTDQYGLGMLLYVALTRESPWGSLRDAELLRAILQGHYPAPRKLRPEISEGLEQITLKAMAVDRGHRFTSLHALGQELLRHATREGQALWTGHFTNVPRPMLPAVSVPLSRPMGGNTATEFDGAPGQGQKFSETDTTVKDASHALGALDRPVESALAPLVPTKILPIDMAYDRARGRNGAGFPRPTDRAVPAGTPQEARAAALPRGTHKVAAQAVALTTKTTNPRNGGVDGKLRLRLFLVGLAGVAAVGGIVALAMGLPVSSRPRRELEPHGAEPSLPVTEPMGVADARPAEGKATNALATSELREVAPRPSGLPEHGRIPKTVRRALAEPVRTEGRKKGSGEGPKRPRLRFLEDGSPLLE